MSEVYVVTKQGVYLQGIVGIYTDEELAKEAALSAAADDCDSYHTYYVYSYNTNQSYLEKNAYAEQICLETPSLFHCRRVDAIKAKEQ